MRTKIKLTAVAALMLASAIRTPASAATIDPTWGWGGTPFTITDVPPYYMQPTDVVLFYPDGTNPAWGVPVNDAVISSEGGTVTGTVPLSLMNGSYWVTVRPSATGSPDFNDVAFQVADENPNVVPLPGALPLFATGLGALGLLGWRRKRKAASA